MRNSVSCVRSVVTSDLSVQKNAASWHIRSGEGATSSLAAPDEETVSLTFCCRQLDSINCLDSIGVFHPKVFLLHGREGFDTGSEVLARVQPFATWLGTPAVKQGLRRGAVMLGFGIDAAEYVDYWMTMNISSTRNPQTRFFGIRFTNECRSATDTAWRANWFRQALEKLGLSQDVRVRLERSKLTFAADLPWNVQASSEDSTPEKNPLEMRISSFASWMTILPPVTALIGSLNDKVLRTKFIVELSMTAYESVRASVPRLCDAWEMNVFGHPTEAVSLWLAGKQSKRPPGRIPIGHGWEGDPNLGFPYSVCVVETPEGPCIELGSDTATHDQLQSLSKYFDGLTFHPV